MRIFFVSCSRKQIELDKKFFTYKYQTDFIEQRLPLIMKYNYWNFIWKSWISLKIVVRDTTKSVRLVNDKEVVRKIRIYGSLEMSTQRRITGT